MAVLITGSTGFLGRYLMPMFKVAYPEVVGVSRHGGDDYQYDLTDPLAVENIMAKVKPRLIVHAAALTDVTRCQKEPELAFKVNTEMVKNIVTFMPKNCKLIYISTDMVYSGVGPHKEYSESENPINLYGLSKYMGEKAAAKAGQYLNLRTNMYGFSRGSAWASSLVDSMIKKLTSEVTFQLFTDAIFSPLYVETLAGIILNLSISSRTSTGTFNIGASNGMSKSKFTLLLADAVGLSAYNARPVESVSMPNRVPRPLDTRLDITRIEGLGYSMPRMENDMAVMFKKAKWKE